LLRRGSRFVLDNNLVIAAVKSGWTKSTNLLMTILLSDAELFVNDELLLEYERYIHRILGLYHLCLLISNRAQHIDPSRQSLEACRPFFPESQYADIVHAATCLEAGATIITNDVHFKKIQEAGIIEVWSISKAIREILDKGD
jgi:predicted nucleic acid-binding protein